MRRLSFSVLALALAAILAPAAALASPSVDVSGTWEVLSGGCGCTFEETYAMDASGNVTGTGPQPDWTVTGNVSGSTFTYTDHYDGGYESHVTVTLSGDGNTYEGSFEDNGGSTGEIKGKRASGGGSKEKEKEGEKGKGPAGKLLSGTGVSCNLDVASGNFTCTAQVGDASGESPQKTPGGTVAFALKPGGEGVFTAGSSCALAASSSGPTSFCSVTYRPGLIAIPPGEQPQIVATYSGDGTFEPSSNAPANEYTVNVEGLENARALDCELFWEAPGCEQLLGSPGKTSSCVALAAKCKDLIEKALRERSISLTGEVPASLVGSVECEQTSPAAASRVRAHAAKKIKEILEQGGTLCEVEAALKSKDPEVIKQAEAALEWDLNRRHWQAEVDAVKGVLGEEMTDTCGKDACSKAVALAYAEALDLYLENLKKAAGQNGPFEPFQIPASHCSGETDATSYNECIKALEEVNNATRKKLEYLQKTKSELGLTSPKPKVGASGSSLKLALAAAAKHKRHGVALANGDVRLQLGHKGKIKLTLPAQARSLLKKLKHRGVKQLKATLTIRTTVIGGREVTRTLPLQLRLNKR
jgi:hypothetical protein